jgi:hypothetical protein
MNQFRKGDVVSVQGTIDSGFVHEGRIKIRVGPYGDVFADLADIKMVQPVVEVGDSVTYPQEGYKAGEVLAILDGYCWVKLAATPHPNAPLGESIDNGMRVSWPLASLNRVDPEPPQADAEKEIAA